MRSRIGNELTFHRINLLGCPVDHMSISGCVQRLESAIIEKRQCHIVVINAAKLVKAQSDPDLRDVLWNADLVGADGVPIVWASRLMGDPLPGRVNGTDLMEKLIRLAAQKGYTIYFLGARQAVLKSAIDYVQTVFPNLNIAGYRHGYFETMNDEEETVLSINKADPDILLLGMGTPMKENWVKRHKNDLNVRVIHGVGGSFDILGGATRRAPRWMQETGLEWLFRLILEPRRMWKRYCITNTVFIFLMGKLAWNRLFRKRR
ncbi:MAG: WecB/TagA/CpsF family glycosyltransferase [candidate division KSB1 bacterium]|nr:WecB/TagA/CpsF family glycosyltransferase [candidate division KSB1 bacterium]